MRMKMMRRIGGKRHNIFPDINAMIGAYYVHVICTAADWRPDRNDSETR
jgi:hypothetical protein